MIICLIFIIVFRHIIYETWFIIYVNYSILNAIDLFHILNIIYLYYFFLNNFHCYDKFHNN